MRILALDTATSATTVALAELRAAGSALDESAVELRDDPTPGSRPNHTRRLLELIEAVMAQTGVDWSDIDRLAVGVGPGTFTGLRIGIATAQALAYSRGLPLTPVSTLEALALPAVDATPEQAVIAVLDARRGEAFAAAWRAGDRPGPKPPVLPPAVLDPPSLQMAAAELGPGSLAVGDGAIKFAADLRHSGLIVAPEDSELHRVSALAHCRLAVDLEPGRPGDVQPEYLREPDAEIARQP
ncbi:MAG TPA: tRNA (adenosine(37)-N6)-threonylcarbamoyltransferase complex dimerization subunit type 1 TsaB [Solirubrobacteraceae bacterium]|nr:tRNA (adenosine(37)-N6)-threonylcarbamoyltransferase complex dimerization subunit type 1 TsaB [Solirubrobacteraceae bacterium]